MIDHVEIAAIIQYIEDHPEEWDQRMWACGTTCCFAGHAVRRAGHEFWWGVDVERDRFVDASAVTDVAVLVKSGERISEVAAELLGLDWFQSARLFYSMNALDDLKRAAKELYEEDHQERDSA